MGGVWVGWLEQVGINLTYSQPKAGAEVGTWQKIRWSEKSFIYKIFSLQILVVQNFLFLVISLASYDTWNYSKSLG